MKWWALLASWRSTFTQNVLSFMHRFVRQSRTIVLMRLEAIFDLLIIRGLQVKSTLVMSVKHCFDVVSVLKRPYSLKFLALMNNDGCLNTP
jgi:hypothetical protein